MISIEHTLPRTEWQKNILAQYHSMRGDLNIFISDYSREKWGWSGQEASVIHHGIDTEIFCPPTTEDERECQALSVVNDWINRDWCCGFNFWAEATSYPNYEFPVSVVGDTKGLSKPAESTEALISEYQKSLIFVNTSLISPVPTSLLEAMSCGCAVVSTSNCMIPEIIKDGENGFLTNNALEMKKIIKRLMDDRALCKKIGQNARKTILEKFNIQSFVEEWNKAFISCLENYNG